MKYASTSSVVPLAHQCLRARFPVEPAGSVTCFLSLVEANDTPRHHRWTAAYFLHSPEKLWLWVVHRKDATAADRYDSGSGSPSDANLDRRYTPIWRLGSQAAGASLSTLDHNRIFLHIFPQHDRGPTPRTIVGKSLFFSSFFYQPRETCWQRFRASLGCKGPSGG